MQNLYSCALTRKTFHFKILSSDILSLRPFFHLKRSPQPEKILAACLRILISGEDLPENSKLKKFEFFILKILMKALPCFQLKNFFNSALSKRRLALKFNPAHGKKFSENQRQNLTPAF